MDRNTFIRIFYISLFLVSVVELLLFPNPSNKIQKIYECNLWVAPLALALFSIIVLLFSIQYSKNYEKFLSNTKELRLAIAVLLLFLNVFFGLLAFGIFNNPEEFLNPKLEWFVGLFSVIGLIGTIWAVWAKIKADAAFDKAKEASENAVKAFRAIGGIVDFDELLIPENTDVGTKQNVPMLNDLLNISHDKLIMILGIPAVGFFKDEMRDKALNFCDHITHTLRRLKNNPNAKIRLIFMSLGKIDELIDKLEPSKYSDENKIILKQRIKTPYENLLNEIHLIQKENRKIKENGNDVEVIKYKEYTFDPGIRFVLSISREPNKLFEKKAVVWIVPDMETNINNFKSAGYTTRDSQMIDIWEKLADYYVDKLI